MAARQSGLASAELLNLRSVEWPTNTDGLALAFDPFTRRSGQTRSPETGNWYGAEWQVTGSAALNDFSGTMDFSGGYFVEPEGGPEVVAVCQPHDQFTLEIVLSADKAQPASPARIVSLEGAGSEGSPNFVLAQEGDELILTLRTDGEGSLGAGANPATISGDVASDADLPRRRADRLSGGQRRVSNGHAARHANGLVAGPAGNRR